jgi:2-polyprenyl-3-methyl-5-hydroxy-6-metoxy-1,4-benzoquinol methylase
MHESGLISSPTSCPLCGAAAAHVIDRFAASDIVSLYRRLVQMDVADEFGIVSDLSVRRCNVCDLMFFNPMVSGSGPFYDTLQKTEGYYIESKEEYEVGAGFIKEDFAVLEIGCGHGAFARKIHPGEYVGLELSEDAVATVRAQGFNVLRETIEDHAALHGAHYDAVCAFQVMEHLPDIKGFVESALSCLKPGGILIVSVPSADTFVSQVMNNHLNLPPHHTSWWSDKCLRSIGDIFGLEIVMLEHERLADIYRFWYLHTRLVAFFKRLLMMGPSVVSISLRFRIANKMAAIIARKWSGSMKFKTVPWGHSVNAVYRKPLHA